MRLPPAGRPHRPRLSLRHRMSLVMAGFVAVVLSLSLLLARHVLTQSAEEAAYGRLARVAAEIASSAAEYAERRVAELQQLAASPALHALLDTPHAIDSTAAAAVDGELAALLPASRTGVGAELWSADGRRVFTFSQSASGDPPPLGSAQPVHSPLRAQSDGTTAWTVVPVTTPAGRHGYLATEMRVGGPRDATQRLSAVAGEEVLLFLRNRDGSVWAQQPGGPLPAPPERLAGAAPAYRLPDVGTALAVEQPVDDTPWMLTAATPLAQVHGRTNGTLWQLTLASLALLAFAVVGATAFGSSLARPLDALARAAGAMTAGDYSQRVAVSGDDEVGALAATFNDMASELEMSRRDLMQLVDEAQQARVEAERLRAIADIAREHAERASRAKSDFLAVVSHELRTPLNAIGGYAQLLDLGVYGALNEEQRNALRRVASNQGQLVQLIDDILSYAHLEGGRMPFAIADVPLADVVARLEPTLSPQIRARGLSYEQPDVDPCITVRGDAVRIQQILLNLLVNAVKFTPAGGRVTVECDAGPDTVQIRVRDSGIGIPPDRLAQIFEPFVQVERTHSNPSEGVGLGLPISRELARAMGGDVSVVSVPGRGSIFTLTLPRGAQVPEPFRS